MDEHDCFGRVATADAYKGLTKTKPEAYTSKKNEVNQSLSFFTSKEEELKICLARTTAAARATRVYLAEI